MIRIHLLDDHPIIADGLRQRLKHMKGQVTMTGSSVNIESLIRNTQPSSFDILILDLWLPGCDPIDNLQTIRRHFPEKPVIVYTTEMSSFWIMTLENQGASAYILKSAGKDEFIGTILAVSQGRTVFPSIATSTGTVPGEEKTAMPCFSLKPTEKAVLVKLSSGLSLKAIAKSHNQSVSNIEKTLKGIRKQAGVKTNPELIRVVMAQHMLPCTQSPGDLTIPNLTLSSEDDTNSSQ